MRTIRWNQAAERIGLSTIPLLLLLSACSPDAETPVSPTDPAAAPYAGRDCLGRSGDCAANRNGRIAWTQINKDYTAFVIFSARLDGSDRQQLTFPEPGVAEDGHADWSPDGSTIIFERDYAGDLGIAQIFRMNADGTGLTLLTACTGDCLGNAFPSYSPDGQHIAFIRWIGPVRPDEQATSGGIWVMNADGSDPVQLTQLRLPTTTEDSRPRWSPDGRSLAFTRLNTVAEPQWRQAVFVSAANGSGARRITPWSLDANVPFWSPDGTRLLVSAHDDAITPGIGALYTIRPDGSGLHKVVPRGLVQAPGSPRLAENGKFSPDGKSIVFQHEIAPDWCCVIYRMDAEGGHVQRLTLSDDPAYAPNWGTHR